MSRNTQHQFASTDPSELVSALVAAYEKITGVSVQPASPEKLFIQWVADIIIQERVINNYTGNQNIPSRAEGENLDALGELFYVQDRPAAQAAVCMERFYISEPQATAILIPVGTRVTDASSTLVWETVADVYVPIGASYADVQIRCQTVGVAGNDYAAGQINTIVDVFDYADLRQRRHGQGQLDPEICGMIAWEHGPGAVKADDPAPAGLMLRKMDRRSGEKVV